MWNVGGTTEDESMLAEVTFHVEADPDGGKTQWPLKEAGCLPYPGRHGAGLLGGSGVHLTWPHASP